MAATETASVAEVPADFFPLAKLGCLIILSMLEM